MKIKIEFEGDSVTDAGRDRSDTHNLAGYAARVAEILGDKYEYVDTACSGDMSANVLERYDTAIRAEKPDLLTLMIGINDVWRRFDSMLYVSVDTFRKNLREIVTKTKTDFPDCKVILIEPFLLPHPGKAYFRPTLIEFIDAVRDIAAELADGFVPMDGILAKARMNTDWSLLSEDGVHPAEAGQRVIAGAVAAEIERVLA